MQLIKPLLAGAALTALTACAGPASPSPQTPVVPSTSSATQTPGTTLTTPAEWLTPSATPSTSASATPPTTPTPSASPSATVTFDSYPTQYKFAVLHSIQSVNGTMAAVLDPVTMCMRPAKDAACIAALGEDAEWAVVNQNTRAYTVPFAAGATVKLLNSGQPDDYSTSAPKPKVWTGNQRVVFEVVSNGSTLSSVTEWWHP